MTLRRCLFVAAVALAGIANAAAPPTEWVDAATGHRIVRLSTEPGTKSLYFHQNSITPDGRYVIVSAPSGIVSIEIATRKQTLLSPGADTLLFVGHKSGLVYFARSKGVMSPEQRQPTDIFAIAASGGAPKKIATVARGNVASINADETLLLGVFAEREWVLETGKRDSRFDAAYEAKDKDGKPLPFALAKEVRLDQRAEAGIPMEMFTVNIASGEQRIIHKSTQWLNHL